jgi:hypothetical protein
MSQHLPNPAPPSHVKRFRTNPVELAIFSVITLIFFNSVYNLFYDQQGFRPAALKPMAATPISEGRSPASASVPQAFVNVGVRCDANADKDTTATKVRLTGMLCGEGRAPASDATTLVKAQVTNTANKFAATVFTDVNSGKFSTDYIPLNLGKNPIRIEFSYRGGKVVTQDFNVVKN